MFKVCRDDMSCEVKKNHSEWFFWGGLKKWKNSLSIVYGGIDHRSREN